MKTFLMFFLVCCMFNLSKAQETTVPNESSSGKFFLGANLRSNFSSSDKIGMGFRLSGGYILSEHFSLLFSSGYVSTFANPVSYQSGRIYDDKSGEYLILTESSGYINPHVIPVDLSLRYSFDLFGVKPYALISLGWDFGFNTLGYEVVRETRYESTNQLIESKSGKASEFYNADGNYNEFQSSSGIGVLIPMMDKFNLDLQYSMFNSSVGNIQSLAFGFEFGF